MKPKKLSKPRSVGKYFSLEFPSSHLPIKLVEYPNSRNNDGKRCSSEIGTPRSSAADIEGPWVPLNLRIKLSAYY